MEVLYNAPSHIMWKILELVINLQNPQNEDMSKFKKTLDLLIDDKFPMLTEDTKIFHNMLVIK